MGPLQHAFLYLVAAVIAVPFAKRLGLGSVLGYLIAGVVLGPALGLVGSESKDIKHFAEFGVVMMLFLVGLELQPKMLWRMRAQLLGLGGLQVLVTMLAFTGIGIALGQPWQSALAIGMTLALSSTAIVLQTLNEKGWMKSTAGQSSFSVLALPGHRGHPDARAATAARDRCPCNQQGRRARTLADRSRLPGWAPGPRDPRHHRGHRARRTLPRASGVPLHRVRAPARDIRRRGAAAW